MADFIYFITENADKLGYIGVFIAVMLEYACFPMSSEILFPFIGASIYNTKMNLFFAVTVSAIGAVTGCSICFYVGRLQKKALNKVVSKKENVKNGIDKAEEKFRKYGDFSVFVLRFLPVVRTYISFPAGMSGMSFKRFALFSFCGAFVWNSLLMTAGFILGEYWKMITDFMTRYKWIFNAVIFIGIIYLVYQLIKNKA